MKVESLRYFVAVAQTGSVSRAAARLGRNRTTVSMAIAALEDELAAPLFRRSGNSMALSPAGEAMVDDAVRLIALADKLRRNVDHSRDGEPAKLRLGRDDVLPEAFWRQIIRDLRQHRLGLELNMLYASPEVLLRQLHQGQLDLACCLGGPGLQAGPEIHSRVLGRITMTLAVAQDHPLCQLSQVSNADLADVPQVVYLDQAGEARFHVPEVAGERLGLSSFELVRDAIRDGLGWGYVPAPLLAGLSETAGSGLGTVAHGQVSTWLPYLAHSSTVPGDDSTVLGWLSQRIEAQMHSLRFGSLSAE